MAENLPPSSTDVTQSGSLNLPEPSGPHRAVMGMLYLIHYAYPFPISAIYLMIPVRNILDIYAYKDIYIYIEM
jgi:hypothetical protein